MKRVITLSWEIGSGGLEVGRRAAERLKFRYVDDELIFNIAYRAGISEEAVRAYDQETFDPLQVALRDFFSHFDALLPSWADLAVEGPREYADLPVELQKFYKGRYLELVQEMIRKLADRGDVLIVGRGAQVLLRDLAGALHVRIMAPLEDRIRRAARELEVPERQARRYVLRRDGAAARYLQHFYQADWEDPSLYHLILNTSLLGIPRAVETIAAAAGAPPSLMAP